MSLSTPTLARQLAIWAINTQQFPDTNYTQGGGGSRGNEDDREGWMGQRLGVSIARSGLGGDGLEDGG